MLQDTAPGGFPHPPTEPAKLRLCHYLHILLNGIFLEREHGVFLMLTLTELSLTTLPSQSGESLGFRSG